MGMDGGEMSKDEKRPLLAFLAGLLEPYIELIESAGRNPGSNPAPPLLEPLSQYLKEAPLSLISNKHASANDETWTDLVARLSVEDVGKGPAVSECFCVPDPALSLLSAHKRLTERVQACIEHRTSLKSSFSYTVDQSSCDYGYEDG
jgi:hypothetical protein